MISVLAATVFRNRAQEGRKGRGRERECGCLPRCLVVEHGIENHEQLAHAGGERRFRIFPARSQLGVKILDDWIAAHSRHRRHIQDAPDLRATAPDTTAAAQFSTIAVKWCQPGQGGGA